jgi:hypothetical protein
MPGTPVAPNPVPPRQSASKKGRFRMPQQMRIDELLKRIKGEYLEMPGLRLTAAQAQRLWGLERTSCDALLAALVDTKFLFRTRDGAFVRSDTAALTA